MQKSAKICNEDALLRKTFKGNPRRCQLIRARLDELADADNLSIMRLIPQAYCHELKGNRKGQIAVKLDQGYRLVFEPANEPVSTKPDGGIEWAQVTVVRILKLAEDYHE